MAEKIYTCEFVFPTAWSYRKRKDFLKITVDTETYDGNKVKDPSIHLYFENKLARDYFIAACQVRGYEAIETNYKTPTKTPLQITRLSNKNYL